MRYVVEFELHSALVGTLGEAVQKAMSALGSIEKLKIAPVRTYTWVIQADRLQSDVDKP
jgi:hypothetical protein